MNKELARKLKWFVAFANMELDSLTTGDKAKLRVEAAENLFPQEDIKKIMHQEPVFQLPTEMLEKTPGLLWLRRYELARGMEWALQPPPNMESEEYWSRIKNLQVLVNGTLLQILLLAKQEKKYPINLQGISFLSFQKNDASFVLSSTPIAVNEEEFVKFKILQLLNGLPLTTINVCQECKKFFVNSSRRKKLFCSQDCNWKFHGRIFRQTDEYKKSQSEKMKKRYKEQRAKKRGVPVERVKIQHKRTHKKGGK